MVKKVQQQQKSSVCIESKRVICVSHHQFIQHFDTKWSLYHNTYLIIGICGQPGMDIKRWTTGWRLLFRHVEYIIFQALFTVSNYLLKGVHHPKKEMEFIHYSFIMYYYYYILI